MLPNIKVRVPIIVSRAIFLAMTVNTNTLHSHTHTHTHTHTHSTHRPICLQDAPGVFSSTAHKHKQTHIDTDTHTHYCFQCLYTHSQFSNSFITVLFLLITLTYFLLLSECVCVCVCVWVCVWERELQPNLCFKGFAAVMRADKLLLW